MLTLCYLAISNLLYEMHEEFFNLLLQSLKQRFMTMIIIIAITEEKICSTYAFVIKIF